MPETEPFPLFEIPPLAPNSNEFTISILETRFISLRYQIEDNSLLECSGAGLGLSFS
jgi:hypothetical protein